METLLPNDNLGFARQEPLKVIGKYQEKHKNGSLKPTSEILVTSGIRKLATVMELRCLFGRRKREKKNPVPPLYKFCMHYMQVLTI